MIIPLILLSVLCSSSAQLALKVGMNRFDYQLVDYSLSSLWMLVWKLAMNPYLVLGISLHLLALVSWLYVLKKVEVSYAYPFTALGFVFVLLVGSMFMGETLNVYKVTGIACIFIGILILARSL